MKFLILFFVFLASSLAVLDQGAFAVLGCDVAHCYSLEQSSRSSPVDGLQYELDSPDLFIDQTDCENIAVATGWLLTLEDNNGNREWVESGVTTGNVENVGCVTELRTYYALNNVVDMNPVYQEFLIPNGSVDPGDDVEITLEKHLANHVRVFVTTPNISSPFPIAQLSFNHNNIYFADFGIEGTVSASDEYSSIPMSKFTGMKIKQDNSWIGLPNSATLYTSDSAED